ncbi:hypothetical protein [Rhodococcus sp. NPDC057529]|uniref:hypothetical protein n=1 Tax=Rhodococcus sp. NPDC057529 TaxID=3346158 RepID=UPI00366F30E5
MPFSDIQNKGKATLSEWQRSGARPLRVTRRDDEHLVLMTAARADQEREVLAAAAMADALLHSDDRDLVRKVVAAAFPWVSYLSGEEVADFVDELIASLRAGSSLDNPAPPARTIATRRHTAEVYADPELARIVSASTEGDFGAVPVPEL